MRLISAVLGFVLRKSGLLGALVLSLFLGYLLIQALVPTLREAVADRERLQQVAEERAALEEDLEQLRSTAAESPEQGDRVAGGQDRRRDRGGAPQRHREEGGGRGPACGQGRRLRLPPEPAREAADRPEPVRGRDEGTGGGGRSAGHPRTEPRRGRGGRGRPRRPHLTNQEKLDRLGEGGDQSPPRGRSTTRSRSWARRRPRRRAWRKPRRPGSGWVVDQWARSWKWLAAIALLALVLPAALRIVSYFLLMPMVSRAHRPIHLAAGSENATADLRTSDAQRTLTIELGAGEVLSARSEHVRPVQGQIRSRPPLRLGVAVHQLRGRALRTEPDHRR